MSLKAIIFDFGGVLVRTRSQHLRTAWEQRLGLPPGGAEALIFGGERGTAVQHGRITDEAHWQWLGSHLGLGPADLAALRTDFFAEDFLDTDLLAYADRLRSAGFHLGLLSNAGDNARWIFGERFAVLPHFDSVTISAEEGVMKPAPRIFEIALARAGAAPTRPSSSTISPPTSKAPAASASTPSTSAPPPKRSTTSPPSPASAPPPRHKKTSAVLRGGPSSS